MKDIFNIEDKDFSSLGVRIQLFDEVVSFEATEDGMMRNGSLVYITRKDFDEFVDTIIASRFKELWNGDHL